MLSDQDIIHYANQAGLESEIEQDAELGLINRAHLIRRLIAIEPHDELARELEEA